MSWIDCLVRLPKEQPGKEYLIKLVDGRMAVAEASYPFGNRAEILWCAAGEVEFDADKVTHWACLPDYP